MTRTIRTVAVAMTVVLAAFTGVALGTAATTTTTTDGQTNQNATVAFSDQQTDGDAVTVDAATLPDGGFAVVHDDDGARLGHSEYLTAGDHEDVTVSLNESVEQPQVLVVTLYRNNASESYDPTEDTVAYQTDTETNVSDVAYVYFEERSRSSADETATTVETETTTVETETTSVESTSEGDAEDASGSIPGFTPITAVAALVAAALVALRRD